MKIDFHLYSHNAHTYTRPLRVCVYVSVCLCTYMHVRVYTYCVVKQNKKCKGFYCTNSTKRFKYNSSQTYCIPYDVQIVLFEAVYTNGH